MDFQHLMEQAGLDDSEQNSLLQLLQEEHLEGFANDLCDQIEIIPEEQETEYAQIPSRLYQLTET